MSFQRWLNRREYGLPPRIGDGDFIMNRIYNSVQSYSEWNALGDKSNSFGAIFNLEFSPEGNVLVAACEKKSILVFDAISTKRTNQIIDAHTDNVNCIRFLDDHKFATCSDDTTVALWDLRYLKNKVRSLHGHSNWVKNIEYSHKDNLLVTSGFDGSIFTWDINSHTEQGLIYQRVFHTSGLMRCRISPDGSKLVICTTGGYLMIIHNLDLTTLHKDLCGFRPSIFRLMQMGHQYIPQAAKFDHVFSKRQKKNRVELVTDFPEKNDAEVILALQIHPHGHSFLSRNISVDELTEWSCVHDIHEEPGDITEKSKESSGKRKRKLAYDSSTERRSREGNDDESLDSTDDMFLINRRRARYSGRGTTLASQPNSGVLNIMRPESFVPDIWAAEVTVQDRAIRQNRARSSNSVTGYNFVYAISSGVMPGAAVNLTHAVHTSSSSTIRGANSENANANGNGVVRSPNERSSSNANGSSDTSNTSSNDDSPTDIPLQRIRYRALVSPLRNNNKERHIFQNPKKLMYYIQESNKGKGFIKEPCFSSDGRIICSPHNSGVRLLSYNSDCSEYPRSTAQLDEDRDIKQLVEVKTLSDHQSIVLCSKFSPREPLLVTGCRSGKVVWYHPVL